MIRIKERSDKLFKKRQTKKNFLVNSSVHMNDYWMMYLFAFGRCKYFAYKSHWEYIFFLVIYYIVLGMIQIERFFSKKVFIHLFVYIILLRVDGSFYDELPTNINIFQWIDMFLNCFFFLLGWFLINW